MRKHGEAKEEQNISKTDLSVTKSFCPP